MHRGDAGFEGFDFVDVVAVLVALVLGVSGGELGGGRESKGYLEVALLGEGLGAFAEFADPVGALVAGYVGLFVGADVGGLREGLGALGAFVGAQPGVAVLVGLGGVRTCGQLGFGSTETYLEVDGLGEPTVAVFAFLACLLVT